MYTFRRVSKQASRANTLSTLRTSRFYWRHREKEKERESVWVWWGCKPSVSASASVVVGKTRPNTVVEHGSSPGPQLKLKLDFVSFSVILKTSGEGAGAKSAITAAAERAHRKNNQKKFPSICVCLFPLLLSFWLSSGWNPALSIVTFDLLDTFFFCMCCIRKLILEGLRDRRRCGRGQRWRQFKRARGHRRRCRSHQAPWWRCLNTRRHGTQGNECLVTLQRGLVHHTYMYEWCRNQLCPTCQCESVLQGHAAAEGCSRTSPRAHWTGPEQGRIFENIQTIFYTSFSQQEKIKFKKFNNQLVV